MKMAVRVASLDASGTSALAPAADCLKRAGKQPSGRQTMTDLPDRLSIDPDSPFYNEELIQRGVGIRFKGVEKTNVEEYCVSEGWIAVAAGKALDRRGKPLTMKLKGPVEPYLRDEA
jgi:hypothetical protein